MEYGDVAIQPFITGDLVTVDTAQGTARLRVVGLARTPGVNPATTDTARGYMREDALQSLPAFTDVATAPPLGPLRLAHIAVKVTSITQVNATAHALGTLLQAHRVTVLGVSFPEPITAQLRQLDGIFTLVRVLALLAVVMSGILLLNTVTTLIAEQTAIIGTMKAIGGTRDTILRGYLCSVGLYSLLATIPGLGTGHPCRRWARLLPCAGDPAGARPPDGGAWAYCAQPGAWVWRTPVRFSRAALERDRITVRAALTAYGINKGEAALRWPGSDSISPGSRRRPGLACAASSASVPVPR